MSLGELGIKDCNGLPACPGLVPSYNLCPKGSLVPFFVSCYPPQELRQHHLVPGPLWLIYERLAGTEGVSSPQHT